MNLAVFSSISPIFGLIPFAIAFAVDRLTVTKQTAQAKILGIELHLEEPDWGGPISTTYLVHLISFRIGHIMHSLTSREAPSFGVSMEIPVTVRTGGVFGVKEFDFAA